MSIEKKLLGTTPAASGDTPEGVSFDGTNDYLSRSSDLSGNADSKTFTFSAWVYGDGYCYIANDGSSYGFRLVFQASINTLQILGNNSAGTRVLNPVIEFDGVISNTWTHILISIDLANTSNRYVYINDKLASVTWSTYIDDSINFTQSKHNIGSYTNGSSPFTGRLAHVFLDYTYRDLSVTANRRLFIDSDGKPSSTIPSSPILYLPMTDAATAGSNSGTGGDFTVNGVLDTAGRAPNQWNCSASKFDGSNDYLSSTSITGIADGKQLTVSFSLNRPTGTTDQYILYSETTPDYKILLRYGSDERVQLAVRNSANTLVLNCFSEAWATGSLHTCSISVDLTDVSKRHITIDGVSAIDSFGTYTNDNMDLTNTAYQIGQGFGSYAISTIGEVYFDTSYTDLSTDNPFWDADANRPKPVRQVISETGTTPLIALPLQGNDAGNNLGSGGDFTVNSGPYTGARGGSEFWARSAKFDGSTGKLQKTGTISNSDVKTLSFAVAYKTHELTTAKTLFDIRNPTLGDIIIRFQSNSSGQFSIYGYTDGSSSILVCGSTSSITVDEYNIVLFSVDMSDSNKRNFYSNGALNPLGFNYGVWIDNTFPFNSSTIQTNIGVAGGASYHNDDIGFLYFTTDYIDFSQESNRNLFVDQLGYPKDLTPAIDAGTIPNPHVYMKFDDTSALGTNSGTGGDFTVNGTVTAGADVDPNA